MTPLPNIDLDKPVLIAGPTASGKSALALQIARAQGGVIINADAIQVYENWRVLTARPTAEDEAELPHRLYGHISRDADYSVGHWLRDLAPLLDTVRPIIVGGTGLYFTALTKGLVDIPVIPDEIRVSSNQHLEKFGIAHLLNALDAETVSRIDTQNPMRVQRAWEVQQATGKSLAEWQNATPPPLLPAESCNCVVFDIEKDDLNARITQRFDQMLKAGALDEARANLTGWSPGHLSSKAIGAPQLISYLRDEISLDDAREAATIATRQFAKRQRTWFRSKMAAWTAYRPKY